jgi:phage terminase small subunit
MALTNKQKMFVKEYLIDLNATQAAIRAGYSADTAKEIGYENLTKLHIVTEIQEALDQRAERTDIGADYVLKTIKDTTDTLVDGDTEKNAQAIFKGCELLGKHLKLFTDKIETSGEMKVTISSGDADLL